MLEILKDPEIRQATRVHAFCSSDMTGAWGGYRFLESQGVGIDLFSGPVTDNEVGVTYLEGQFGKLAINAFKNRETLAGAVLKLLGDPLPGKAQSTGPEERSRGKR